MCYIQADLCSLSIIPNNIVMIHMLPSYLLNLNVQLWPSWAIIIFRNSHYNETTVIIDSIVLFHNRLKKSPSLFLLIWLHEFNKDEAVLVGN